MVKQVNVINSLQKVTTKNDTKYLIIERENLAQDIGRGVNIRCRRQGRFDLRRDLNPVFQNMPGFVTWKNKDSEYMGSNERMLQLNGIKSINDVIGKYDEDVIWSNEVDARVIRAEDAKVLAGGTTFVLHHYVVHGIDVDMLLKKTPVVDNQENIVGIANHSVNLIKPTSVNIICAAAQFGVKLTSDVVNKIKTYADASARSVFLSSREEECLYYLVRGLSAKEIGRVLNLSGRTIEFYIRGLKDKFSCHKSPALIVKALETGYLENVPLRILLDKLNLNEPLILLNGAEQVSVMDEK
jgi:DNA-binding CsgD family transcriptional regulator